MKSRILALWLFSLIWIANPNAALAQPSYPHPYSDTDLEKVFLDELIEVTEDVRLFHTLDSAQYTLDQSRQCGDFLDKAKETRDELDQLNQVRNKTTEGYGRRAQEVKDANTQAIRDYESCYAKYLPGFARLKENNIVTYAAHTQHYNAMLDKYERVADLDAYILRLEAEIDKRSNGEGVGEVIASVVSVKGHVRVLPNGANKRSEEWRFVGAGYKLRAGDTLETSAGLEAWEQHGSTSLLDNRATLKFQANGESSSVTVNLANESRVLIGKFDAAAHNKRQGVMGLLRGIVYVLTHDAGLNVRTGTSLCGIRGTAIAISYDPTTDTAEYTLDHGDAYAESGGRQVTLKPRTAVTVSHNNVSPPRAISEAQWQGIVTKTGAPFGLADTADSFETLEKKGQKHPDVAIERMPTDLTDPAWTKVFESREVSYATSMTTSLLDALKDADPDKLYELTAGKYHESLNARKAKTGNLRAYLQASKQRPLEYEIGCTVCAADGNKSCWTWADLTTLGDPVNSTRVIFMSERVGNDNRIVNSKPWNIDNEKAFSRMGQAYCE